MRLESEVYDRRAKGDTGDNRRLNRVDLRKIFRFVVSGGFGFCLLVYSLNKCVVELIQLFHFFIA